MPTKHIVALGSSFAAGPGIQPITNAGAGRSGRNYANLVAQALNAKITDLTVSGATTETILDIPQKPVMSFNPFVEAFPPQIQGVPGDADLVTITAGGNNLRYSGSTSKATFKANLQKKLGILSTPLLYVLGDCEIAKVTEEDVTKLINDLKRLISATKSAAPNARIVVVDYLPVFSTSARPSDTLPLSQSDIDAVRAIAAQMDRAFEEAVKGSGADLIKASRLGIGHESDTDQPWITGAEFSRQSAPYHPKLEGMQAIADAIIELLGS